MEALAGSEAAAALKKPARRAAFELKGVMTSLAVLRLCTADLALIERQLRIKIAQLPQFFQAVPVVLDFGAMPKGGSEVRLGALVALLRSCHLIPVGITNAGDDVTRIAVAVGLGVMPLRSGRAPVRATDGGEPGAQRTRNGASPAEVAGGNVSAAVERGVSTGAAAGGKGAPSGTANGTANGEARGVNSSGARAVTASEPVVHRLPMVIRQPVRGGQVIYAQGTDLVILAPVNSGAEVIADGHVHIYATLRGRAVAGAQGLAEARIFCQRLEAELVAVAGAYLMADDIPPDRRGLPSQIYLDGGECRVGAL